jgi:antitoxin HigA-1
MRKKKSMTAGLAPVHPGALLREDILPSVDMPKVKVARALGISRAQMTAPMALRLNMQSNYDLATLSRAMAREIARVPTIEAA